MYIKFYWAERYVEKACKHVDVALVWPTWWWIVALHIVDLYNDLWNSSISRTWTTVTQTPSRYMVRLCIGLIFTICIITLFNFNSRHKICQMILERFCCGFLSFWDRYLSVLEIPICENHQAGSAPWVKLTTFDLSCLLLVKFLMMIKISNVTQKTLIIFLSFETFP